jgi:hypothetical protein
VTIGNMIEIRVPCIIRTGDLALVLSTARPACSAGLRPAETSLALVGKRQFDADQALHARTAAARRRCWRNGPIVN